ncbi:MAG: cytochrome c family protein [Alphaproteobacteria bacterium]|nr:cytochrome c family protein [Alphaproteobacteria bacterium]
MDSLELNKIAAAILIALLTIKGADLISNALIHPALPHENAFKIEGVTPSTATGTQPEKTGPAPIEPLLAAANAQNGALVFKKCTSCHVAEKGGPNKIGPDLYNVVGAEKGKHPGYTYSQAMEKKGGKWTYDDLNHWLYDPRGYIPGNKMSYAGLKNDQERADVIAYLRQQSDNPLPLPDVKPTEEKPAGTPAGNAAPASAEAKPATAPEATNPTAMPETKKNP